MEAQAKNAAVAGLVSSAASVGSAIAVVASDKDNEKKAETLEAIGDANDRIVGASMEVMEGANQTFALNQEEFERFSNSYLRKTTLFPGYYIDGEVRFPYYENAKWYYISFGVGASQVKFDFCQIPVFPQSI